MTVSVSRARSSFPKWKKQKSTWGTIKSKKHWKKTENLIINQKYIIS